VRETRNTGLKFNPKPKKTLGYSGIYNIPILPASVAVYVGNTNWFDGGTHTIDIEYYY